MSASTKCLALLMAMGTLASIEWDQDPAKCQNFNDELDALDIIVDKQFAESNNPLLKELSMPLSKKIDQHLPALNLNSEKGKKYDRIREDSMEMQKWYQAILQKHPHCTRTYKKHR